MARGERIAARGERIAARFLQSARDFPLAVELGERPSWALRRQAGAGLRFLPDGDEGYTLRGDRRRLLYKGRKRSHRFTVLGDTSFEYDCILNREPDSNIVAITLEGAEGFEFCRQPDWLTDPLLAGSYAVYKKDTLAGEGTGKLCHIHRPCIIDARGRRVWGDLRVLGDKLLIAIPEGWLADAAYPVTVDPVVGTATVGSQTLWDSDPPEPWEPLCFDGTIPVNRFLLNDRIDGQCTAYFYTYDNRDPYEGGCAVLYSDSGNKPLTRRSADEQFIDFTVNGSRPPGWRGGTFRSAGAVAGGSYVWFGLFCLYLWYPRFDYGLGCYNQMWGDEAIPDTYPQKYLSPYENFRLSMYFEYSSAQNYTRTLTQGVRLSDSRALTGNYLRAASAQGDNSAGANRAAHFYREHVAGGKVTDAVSRIKGYCRHAADGLFMHGVAGSGRGIRRGFSEGVRSDGAQSRSVGHNRNIGNTAFSAAAAAWGRAFYRFINAAMQVSSGMAHAWDFARHLEIFGFVSTGAGHGGDYIRGLYTAAGNLAVPRQAAGYRRFAADWAGNGAYALRHLFVFVRLVTGGVIRDLLLGRFLKAKEDLVLKSPLCREMVLESRIH
jgi:hypothetical protein